MENIPITEPPKPSLLQRAVTYTSLIIVGFATIAACVFLYWTIQNPIILQVKGVPFPVRPTNNSVGQVEFMAVDYCKTYNATGTVRARMVGKKSIITIPWPLESSPPQCLKTDVPIPIPLYASDDTYYFDFIVTYQVNPIKTETVEFRSQSFALDGVVQ